MSMHCFVAVILCSTLCFWIYACLPSCQYQIYF